MSIRWLKGENGDAIAVDDSYFPIVIATWEGEASPAAVQAYFGWLFEMLARAMRAGVPLVNVTETALAKNPDAAVRRQIADLTKEFGATGADTHPVRAYVAVDNAIIRGALTALKWLYGDMRVVHVPTCQTALELGLRDLEKAGAARPALDPRRWTRPAR